MRIRAPASDARHEDILKLEPLVRRVVGALARDPDTVKTSPKRRWPGTPASASGV